MLDYQLLPEHLRGGMRRYMEDGTEPGSFLTAVLENDLKLACAQADLQNRHLLFDIVSWLYNEAPASAWGNDCNVGAHVKRLRREREQAKAAGA